MQRILIEDPGDLRVADYRDIRERDLVGRRGLFVAEGKVVLNALLAAKRFEPLSALVLDSRLAGLADTLSSAPAEMQVFVATRAVMDAIAGFPIHRGVLALGRKRSPQRAEDLLDGLSHRAILVVLVGMSNHDNVGAIFRNAAAFGVDAVLLDETCCDPLYRKAIRVSVGAVLKTPFAKFDDIGQLLSELAGKGFGVLGLSPGGSRDIRDIERTERLAILVGAEGTGLPTELLAKVETARIGMAEGFDSLNVAAATAIALHHFAAT